MRHRTSTAREKFVANAFCTFKGDRVRLKENICVELNLYNEACAAVMEINSSPTVDPHESRQAAASRMVDCSDFVHLPVVILQLDEGCYRGPSFSKSARRVIAIEARKSYILNSYTKCNLLHFNCFSGMQFIFEPLVPSMCPFHV